MEGPSLVIFRDETVQFCNKKVLDVGGNTKEDILQLKDEELKEILSWGKHLLLRFGKATLRVHFLMFGSYRINERKDREPRLFLRFENGEMNFYSCSDWRTDLMSPAWDEKHVLKLLRKKADAMVCDALMDQDIFSGLGNIIKNEVLYLLRIHPEARVGDLALKQLRLLVKESRAYCFRFYEWKKAYVLKRNWKIFRKRKCPVCGAPATVGRTGILQRLSYYCGRCQPLDA
jgi:endonuclease VIII